MWNMILNENVVKRIRSQTDDVHITGLHELPMYSSV